MSENGQPARARVAKVVGMNMERVFTDRFETPVGEFVLVADEAGRLRAAGFAEAHARMERHLGVFADARRFRLEAARNPGGLRDAMRAYFAGDLAVLDALPAEGVGTPFQQKVWRALRDIPCGETRSYGELARAIGQPAAVRAVGLANGANPVSIVVPCHRVIGADGTLTGYAGGLERKRWLLAHETRHLSGGARPEALPGRAHRHADLLAVP